LPAKQFVDALLITCSFAINVELKVCNIFVRHILLTKENQISEQKRKHKYPAFFFMKRE